jgi:hypothetical protein
LNNLSVNKKELKALNAFWAGFILYSLAFTISDALITKNHINYNVARLCQSIGAMLFIVASIFLIRLKIENKYLKFVFVIYITWILIVIIRGFELDSFKDYIYSPGLGIFPYLAPLIILFPQNILSYKKMFYVIGILSIFYII